VNFQCFRDDGSKYSLWNTGNSLHYWQGWSPRKTSLHSVVVIVSNCTLSVVNIEVIEISISGLITKTVTCLQHGWCDWNTFWLIDWFCTAVMLFTCIWDIYIYIYEVFHGFLQSLWVNALIIYWNRAWLPLYKSLPAHLWTSSHLISCYKTCEDETSSLNNLTVTHPKLSLKRLKNNSESMAISLWVPHQAYIQTIQPTG